MTRRGPQLVCKCSAYPFPHRLGGGKCYGREWAEAYFLWVKEECEFCNANSGWCEVATGQEPISRCQGKAAWLHAGETRKLPMSDEEIELHYAPEEEYNEDNEYISDIKKPGDYPGNDTPA